ncbi:hypothetical protein ACJX0J_041358, partial [Zea mays]
AVKSIFIILILVLIDVGEDQRTLDADRLNSERSLYFINVNVFTVAFSLKAKGTKNRAALVNRELLGNLFWFHFTLIDIKNIPHLNNIKCLED